MDNFTKIVLIAIVTILYLIVSYNILDIIL